MSVWNPHQELHDAQSSENWVRWWMGPIYKRWAGPGVGTRHWNLHPAASLQLSRLWNQSGGRNCLIMGLPFVGNIQNTELWCVDTFKWQIITWSKSFFSKRFSDPLIYIQQTIEFPFDAGENAGKVETIAWISADNRGEARCRSNIITLDATKGCQASIVQTTTPPKYQRRWGAFQCNNDSPPYNSESTLGYSFLLGTLLHYFWNPTTRISNSCCCCYFYRCRYLKIFDFWIFLQIFRLFLIVWVHYSITALLSGPHHAACVIMWVCMSNHGNTRALWVPARLSEGERF